MSGSLVGGIVVALFIIYIFVLLRRHQLREKYAVIWVVIGLAILVLVLFPELLYWGTELVGIRTPVNLLFAATFLLVLGVCLHLTYEVSRSEDRIRRLAEEIALLRLKVSHLEEHHPDPDDPDASSE